VPIGGPRSWSPVIIGSIASGLIGYSLSTFGPFSLIPQALGEAEPKYGTPKDFELAIKELRASFDSDEVVSTHPEDLRIHGYSENDHHASEKFCCAKLCSSLMLTSQAHRTPSSYSRGVQKM
jgi:D-lactate dehydrogenase (cytochrome)